MSLSELTTVVEGDLPSGRHWILRAAVATDAGLGVTYFAALLPRTTGLAELIPLDPAGHPLTLWPSHGLHPRVLLPHPSHPL